ncbi:MAG TPA: sulfotransferase family 2 domain-containing protein [Bacillales bacterium]
MIISHKYQFIFLKTRKTAGTSLEISLSRYCGDGDILTPVKPEDEKIRDQLGEQPQNYEKPPEETGLKEKVKQIVAGEEPKKFYNHIPAEEVKEKVDDDIWNSYYKFCFERNPWDKAISAYYYMMGTTHKGKDMSFDDFLRKLDIFEGRVYNYPIYSINGEVAVDFIGKYETLEEDLNKVCREVGIPFDGWLPNAKGKFRKDKVPYQQQYTNEQKDRIQEYFKKEIDLLGYEF